MELLCFLVAGRARLLLPFEFHVVWRNRGNFMESQRWQGTPQPRIGHRLLAESRTLDSVCHFSTRSRLL